MQVGRRGRRPRESARAGASALAPCAWWARGRELLAGRRQTEPRTGPLALHRPL